MLDQSATTFKPILRRTMAFYLRKCHVLRKTLTRIQMQVTYSLTVVSIDGAESQQKYH